MELTPKPKTPTNTFNTPPGQPDEIHRRSDVDAGQVSLHHTLGIGRNQSSPGNHLHDGASSEKLGGHVFDTTSGNEGKVIPALTITGSRGGNAAVASLIALLQNFVDFNDNTTP